MTARLARRAELVRRGRIGTLTIDGEEFPWYIDRVVRAEADLDGMHYLDVRILVNDEIVMREEPAIANEAGDSNA